MSRQGADGFFPDSAKIIRTKLGEGDQSFVLRNSMGIVKTGIPIAVIGKKGPLKEPVPTKALPMRAKDDATVNVQYLDVEQVLSYSYVTALHEDKNGIIWIGTDGTGLSKYDGINFITYTTNEGLPGNILRDIYEDKKGNIWIGTENGIAIINFPFKTTQPGQFSVRINASSEKQSGTTLAKFLSWY